MDDLAWVVSGSNPELFSKLHRDTNQWELSEKCQNVNRCVTFRPNGTLAGIRGEASVCQIELCLLLSLNDNLVICNRFLEEQKVIS